MSLISELSKKNVCVVEFFFLETIIFCACIVRSGLNGQSCIFIRSLLSVKAEVVTQSAMVNKEVLSAKSLNSELSSCGCDRSSI